MQQQPGVLPSQWIRAALAEGIVDACQAITTGQIQPNSLDLRIGSVGYRVQCSFLPGEEGIGRKLKRLQWYEFSLPDEGIVLGQNQSFIFPLCERLSLPPHIYARANPKSTTGRLDVFTRLVTEFGTAFDEVPPGYQGPLYLEVVPRSFAIRVRAGDSPAQIRFQIGDPHLTREEAARLADSEAILFDPDLRPLRSQDLRISPGVILSIGLSKKLGPKIGYQARKNTSPIDLRAIGKAREGQYWDPLFAERTPVILEPDEFYLFRSRELVRLPPRYCAEMVAFDASSGEVRTHYAGFFDSGFGYDTEREPGQSAAAVVLEVRSRDVPFLIEDGQPLFRINLMRSTEEPDILYGRKIGSNYQSQGLKLPKQFGGGPAPEDKAAAESLQPSFDFSPAQ